MELLIGRFADARARRAGFARPVPSKRSPESDASGSSAISSSAPSTCASCGSSPASGSRKRPSASKSRTTSRADSARRPEVDDLHRYAPADPIEPADPLFDERRLPGQVEQHQAAAELEVAALASAFGGHEQARTIGFPEPRDLGVAARRRQLLVEDAGRELRPLAERRCAASPASRGARRRRASSPARRASAAPARAARAGADRRRPSTSACSRSVDFVGSEHRAERGSDASARRTRSIFCRRADRVRRSRASHRRLDRVPRAASPPDRRARSACPPAAASRRCRRVASSWCTAAAACRARDAPRSSRPRETPAGAAAAAAGRTRGHRLRAAWRSGAGRDGPGPRSARRRASRVRRDGPSGGGAAALRRRRAGRCPPAPPGRSAAGAPSASRARSPRGDGRRTG